MIALLCSTRGKLIKDGPFDIVLYYYNAIIAKKSQYQQIREVETDYGRTDTRYGTGESRILGVELKDEKGTPARAFKLSDTTRIHCRIQFNAPIQKPTWRF